jgi:hypothetical protein
MNKDNPTKDWANRITYCTRCGSAIYWDDLARPQMLKLGGINVSICMDEGCNLLFMQVPSRCCNKKDLQLLMLGLKEIGVPEEDAMVAVLQLDKTAAAA